MIANPVGPRDPIPGAVEAPPPAASFFTTEKISRIALHIIGYVALGGAILLGAHILAGNVSLWHSLTSICLVAIKNHLTQIAEKIVDFADPEEVRAVRDKLPGKGMLEMLELHPLNTIMQHDLVPLHLLRTRSYQDILDKKLPQLQQHADGLLQHRIITPEMHRIIRENDLAAVEQLPTHRPGMEELFQAFNAAQ